MYVARVAEKDVTYRQARALALLARYKETCLAYFSRSLIGGMNHLLRISVLNCHRNAFSFVLSISANHSQTDVKSIHR